MESCNSNTTESALIADVANILPGEFQLLDYIGEGGHGIVFKALFRPMQQKVAIKLIKNDGTPDLQRQLERMHNEARILARLSHPNIVKVFQLSQCNDGTPFLVCEFVEGQTLASFLALNSVLDQERLNQVFLQLFDALSYSHEHGLIHRDIKPNNIIISVGSHRELIVKLLDFGVARDFDPSFTGPLGLTRTIQITGSAPYMSPEQCSAKPIDFRSDIYSLACVMFECLSGRPPFLGETPVHTRYMQIHEKAKVPSQHTDEDLRLKAELYKLALKALSKNPADRPQSAEEFKKEFISACASSKFGSVRFRKDQRNSKNSRFAWIVISAVLVSICLCLLSYFKNQSKKNVCVPAVNSTHVPIRSHSVQNQLAEIHKKCLAQRRFSSGDFAYLSLNVHALEELVKLSARIDKRDLGTLYALANFRAEIATQLQLDNCEQYLLQALKLCTTADGKQTAEAATCYLNLANLFLRGDLNDAKTQSKIEFYSQKALEIRTLMKTDSIPVLTIAPAIDWRDNSSLTWGPNIALARLAERRGQYDRAIGLLLMVISELREQQEPYNRTHIVLALAEDYEKVGRKNDARNVLEEEFKYLQSIDPPEIANFRDLLKGVRERSRSDLYPVVKKYLLENLASMQAGSLNPAPDRVNVFRELVDELKHD